MKKIIIILFVLLTHNFYGQTEAPSYPNRINKNLPLDVNGRAMMPNNLYYDSNTNKFYWQESFILPPGMSGSYNYATYADTLDGVNDTVEFDFKNQFAFCYVTIRDTGLTTSAGVIDSLVLQIYHPLFNAWSTKAIGLEDISASPAGTIINGDRIVPGTGLIKTYLLRMLYPGKVRVAWVYGANKSGRKTPIIFRGNN